MNRLDAHFASRIKIENIIPLPFLAFLSSPKPLYGDKKVWFAPRLQTQLKNKEQADCRHAQVGLQFSPYDSEVLAPTSQLIRWNHRVILKLSPTSMMEHHGSMLTAPCGAGLTAEAALAGRPSRVLPDNLTCKVLSILVFRSLVHQKESKY
ncbi:hypothetical protein CEXT_189541 [Caerostris extrusa]|uniref:Uncharacterized protein n=1 Tax=Caerostris extrusa TaxID=172846 RepID=A0AAV4X354_CAEEX|nr:hypothetical protein CEXT_189541 [Caerostris extrusa]